jgi:hypothetical protein
MFMCQIMDWEYPLSFSVKADVFGLSVTHELPEDMSNISNKTNNFNATRSNMSDILPGSMYSKGGWD